MIFSVAADLTFENDCLCFSHLVCNKASPAFPEGAHMPPTIRRHELEILPKMFKKVLQIMLENQLNFHFVDFCILHEAEGNPPQWQRRACRSASFRSCNAMGGK